MKIKDVSDYLESIAPPPLQENYDNAGLIVGDPGTEVSGALISLDCTEAVVEEAIKEKCNLIVAHHPIIFGGLKKLNGKNYIERTVIKAIKNDIAIYAAHTNLDNVVTGVNQKISDRLGLVNTRILASKEGILKKLFTFAPLKDAEKVRQSIFASGAGVIGNYDHCSFNVEGTGTFRGLEGTDPYVGRLGEEHHEKEVKIEIVFPAYHQEKIVKALLEGHPYEEVAYDIIALENGHPQVGPGMVGELPAPMDEMAFLQMTKEKMQTDCIRYTALQNKPIKKVALCGGAGNFLLNNAIATDADIFITGDFKYHQFFDADGKILIADIGHYESEQFTKDLFHELLRNKFDTFAVQITSVNTNPIKYL